MRFWDEAVNGTIADILYLGALKLRLEFGSGRSAELVVRANKCWL